MEQVLCAGNTTFTGTGRAVNGSQTNAPNVTPEPIAAPTPDTAWPQVAVGHNFSCALNVDSEAYCW